MALEKAKKIVYLLVYLFQTYGTELNRTFVTANAATAVAFDFPDTAYLTKTEYETWRKIGSPEFG